MNLTTAVSLMNVQAMSYEDKGSKSTGELEEKWAEVASMIANLEDTGQKAFAWYVLTDCEKEKAKAVEILLKRKKLAWNFENHMLVVNEIDAVVSGNGSGTRSDKAYEIHSVIANWESDLLWRLGNL